MITQVPKFGLEAFFLRECETSRGFSSGELKKLVRAAVRISVPAHWPLIHEQTPGDACYILLSGRVAVFSGQDQVAELGPGQLVGEVSIRQGRLRSATVSSSNARRCYASGAKTCPGCSASCRRCGRSSTPP